MATAAPVKEVYLSACKARRCKPNSLFVKQLGDVKDLTVLDFSNNYCGGNNGFSALLAVIQASPSLTLVNLSGNFLSVENIKALVDVLIAHPSVARLKLNNNRLYIDAGKELYRLARMNHRIIEIEVDDRNAENDNKIPVKILEQIRHQLQTNWDLQGQQKRRP
eukprot:RCo006100